MCQTVIIPSTACTATLRFWNQITTSESTASAAYDKMTVTVRNTSNAVQARLAAYKGQTVRIYWSATEDSSL